MPEERPDDKARQDLIDEVRQLKEKLRKLQEGPARTEGLAEGIAAALGRMVPGLGGLIETASRMPEFQQRLAAIDEAVRVKLKQQPLDRAVAGLTGGVGGRQMGIPPSVRRGRPGRGGTAPGGEGKPAGKAARRGGYRQPGSSKVHISPETPAQLPVDVFDEGGRIVVLAEAPGLREADVDVSLEGTVLVLSVHAPHREGVQRIELPCEPAGRPTVALANGILTIQVRKAEQS